ncbi:MAG: hypothetical protein LBJ41_09820 [Treponema sp.]|jgi:hypothetical protein|nr:hypothetical protein [Treponema sp.]
MLIRKFGVALSALCIISMLASCGDDGTLVLPASETYKVNIALNSRSIEQSLTDNPIIRHGDEISPYLLNFSTDDPDVRGLTVFLRTPTGTILDGKVYYTLSGNAIRRNQVNGELDLDPDETLKTLPETETNGDGVGTEIQTQSETVPVEPTPETTTPEPIPILTPEPMSIPVVEAWGGTRGVVEQTFTVERLDQGLPPFMLDSELPIGQYLLVFQVVGVRTVLYQQEKLFYFMDDANFEFNDIQRYLPGVTSIDHLAPPGIAIMFEAQLDFDERLDPYIVWYNSTKRIREGRVADGLNRLIWTVSQQTGFQTIKVEVFPFEPVQKISGVIKELSLAVSSKSKNSGYFAEDGRRFICWYQFQNNLLDAAQPTSAQNALVADGDVSRIPRWLPTATIYGLALGPRDRYLLPLSLPLSTEEEEEQEKQGLGELLLHIKPLRDGAFFKAEFNTKPNPNSTKSDTVELNCSFIAGKPVLLLSEGELTFESSPLVGDSSAYDLLTMSIKFSLSKNIFTASLYVKEFKQETKPLTIALSADLNGKAVLQLGIEDKKEDIDGVTAILDELALVFELDSLPPPPPPYKT